jgi:hypothetical protein
MLSASVLLVALYTFDTMEVLWIDQSKYYLEEVGKSHMKNPVVYYGVIAVGVVALLLGIYWDLLKHDHPFRGVILLVVGVILLIAGIAGFFVMKPKTTTSR